MKRGIILNSGISAVIATMGHTDLLCVCDCGLPIPDSTQRIDISLIKGVPGFIETVNSVIKELVVEEAIVSKEILEKSPEMFNALKKQLGDIPIKFISHEELKLMSHGAKACIRTGECTPYANVILKSGVDF